MTADPDDETGDSISGGPVDFDRLAVIRERLTTDDRFSEVGDQPSFAPERLVCQYDRQLYPDRVRSARLEIVWFETGDFSLHYHETHKTGAFDHRWDRHPSGHNTRDHIHPGPDAPTPGDDTTHPNDWRDVLSTALSEIEARQRGFWTR
ncbi:hypothetical protein PN416_16695 [Halorubrum ezzemoulense]|uniref:hypothetical protein n=1 Tax=Halorubrum TaxID=56688 RepID=UPI0010F662F7|nr:MULTISPECIES: hypothetical protein [Halorubrum]MDB9281506.1 hypothetical protein [Halorubrum ezzemoulense]MDB9285036.1 hypothetical protein [Halorubrum ezzemoulense]TKX35656.1 hypothetical protein EXE52_17845 [Halorubrum sp. CGM4_25_10-8A]